MKTRNYAWEASLRPQHQRISLFALIQCWLKDAEGLVFTRDDLARLLPSGRITRSRIELLRKDMAEFFPCSRYVWYDSKLVAFFASRSPINRTLLRNTYRIPTTETLKANRLDMASLWGKDVSEKLSQSLGVTTIGEGSLDQDAKLLAKYLGRLAQGRIQARRIPDMKRDTKVSC